MEYRAFFKHMDGSLPLAVYAESKVVSCVKSMCTSRSVCRSHFPATAAFIA